MVILLIIYDRQEDWDDEDADDEFTEQLRQEIV